MHFSKCFPVYFLDFIMVLFIKIIFLCTNTTIFKHQWGTLGGHIMGVSVHGTIYLTEFTGAL